MMWCQSRLSRLIIRQLAMMIPSANMTMLSHRQKPAKLRMKTKMIANQSRIPKTRGPYPGHLTSQSLSHRLANQVQARRNQRILINWEANLTKMRILAMHRISDLSNLSRGARIAHLSRRPRTLKVQNPRSCWNRHATTDSLRRNKSTSKVKS